MDLLNNAIKEAYERAPGDVTYYDTLEINHADFTTPIYVVRSFEGINALLVADGEPVDFTPVMFDFSLPETEGGVRGEMTIAINGIPMEARTKIREGASSTDPVTVKYRQYIRTQGETGDWLPDAELPVSLNVVSVKETQLGLEASVMFPDLVGAYFPRRIMTGTAFPGLRQ